MDRKKLEQLTSPNAKNAVKLMLLGSGELAKEIVVEAKRHGFNTVAVDTYEGAPAQQVAE